MLMLLCVAALLAVAGFAVRSGVRRTRPALTAVGLALLCVAVPLAAGGAAQIGGVSTGTW